MSKLSSGINCSTNTNNTLTVESYISGSSVAQMTLTPNSTVASSTTTIAGIATIAGRINFAEHIIGSSATGYFQLTSGSGKAWALSQGGGGAPGAASRVGAHVYRVKAWTLGGPSAVHREPRSDGPGVRRSLWPHMV